MRPPLIPLMLQGRYVGATTNLGLTVGGITLTTGAPPIVLRGSWLPTVAMVGSWLPTITRRKVG